LTWLWNRPKISDYDLNMTDLVKIMSTIWLLCDWLPSSDQKYILNYLKLNLHVALFILLEALNSSHSKKNLPYYKNTIKTYYKLYHSQILSLITGSIVKLINYRSSHLLGISKKIVSNLLFKYLKAKSLSIFFRLLLSPLIRF